jgi:hypothetical protein
MMHLQHAKLIIAPFIAFTIGVFFIISAFVENKGAPGFSDLYPGLSMIAAGFVYIGLLRFALGSETGDDSAETGPSSETNNSTADTDG